jgi:hypothetical protein
MIGIKRVMILRVVKGVKILELKSNQEASTIIIL